MFVFCLRRNEVAHGLAILQIEVRPPVPPPPPVDYSPSFPVLLDVDVHTATKQRRRRRSGILAPSGTAETKKRCRVGNKYARLTGLLQARDRSTSPILQQYITMQKWQTRKRHDTTPTSTVQP